MQIGGTCGLRGIKTVIVDMDPQGTASIWSSQAIDGSPFPATVISLAPMKEKMIGEIGKVLEIYDLILIDCPPAIESPIPWAALNISDLAVIPVIPVMDNIWASRKAAELASRAMVENPDLKTFFLPSMMRKGNIFTACLNLLKNDGEFPVMKSSLGMRNAFPESQLLGATVQALGKTSLAAKEVDAVTDEILTILKMKVKNGK